jgi:hypothetical protein
MEMRTVGRGVPPSRERSFHEPADMRCSDETRRFMVPIRKGNVVEAFFERRSRTIAELANSAMVLGNGFMAPMRVQTWRSKLPMNRPRGNRDVRISVTPVTCLWIRRFMVPMRVQNRRTKLSMNLPLANAVRRTFLSASPPLQGTADRNVCLTGLWLPMHIQTWRSKLSMNRPVTRTLSACF